MTTTTANKADLELMAHLLRRAGFGATRDQLDEFCVKGYEATVEELLSPAYGGPDDQDLLDRYFIASNEARSFQHAWPQWTWRLLTSTKPLEEKMALFWHGLFATGGGKINHGLGMLGQIDMFRRYGLGRFETLILKLSQDPAMLFWLDNQNSHRDAPNENYGRELLELFSMGIDEQGGGAYGEDDVKAAGRAFTGWTLRRVPEPFFLGPFPLEFIYDGRDHDDSAKEFLGRTGNLNGEDICAIVGSHPSTASFVCRRLYQYFVADEPDNEAISHLAGVFSSTGGDITAVMRAIFTSDFFKSESVRFKRVKSPADVVYGTARLSDRWQIPHHDITSLAPAASFMGQSLLNPPSVEGWHEGEEWIDSGGLVERVNFARSEIGRKDAPGVIRMIERVAVDAPDGPAELVDSCLDALGFIAVSRSSRQALTDLAAEAGRIDFAGNPSGSRDRTVEMLQLIVSTPDYQYC